MIRKRRMLKMIARLPYLLLAMFIGASLTNVQALAFDEVFYSQNEPLFYMPGEVCSEAGAGSSSTTGSTCGSQFSIGTFNILASRLNTSSGGGWEARFGRSMGVVKNNKLDVIGFQEVRPDQYEKMKEGVNLGSDYDFYPKTYDKNGPQVPVAWKKDRFEKIDQGTKRVKGGRIYAGQMAARIPIQVHLRDKVSKQEFYVINGHFDSDTQKNKIAEGHWWYKYAKDLQSDTTPVFMTADFNSKLTPVGQMAGANRNDLPYCILTATTFRHVYDIRDNKQGKCPSKSFSKDGGHAANPVDHIFTNDYVEVSEIKRAEAGPFKNGSDVHDTIMAWVNIPGDCDSGSASGITGSDNQEKAWNFFKGKGLTDEQSAAIIGNLMAESSDKIDPKAKNGSNYYGIAQWDTKPGGRWERLKEWAKQKGLDPWKFNTQLQYVWVEGDERGNIAKLKNNPEQDVPHLTWVWGRYFEVAIISGDPDKYPHNLQHFEDARKPKAQSVYNRLKGSGGGGGQSGGSTTKKIVALDPGHGGAVANYIDKKTNIRDRETANSPEREDVLDVAKRIKRSLESTGNYTVILLRTKADQSINKRDRVDKAQKAGADIAISIHTTGGNINEVWPQFTGGYREDKDGKRVTFNNDSTAKLSEKYSTTIAEARTAAEGHNVSMKRGFTSRAGVAGGNLPLVQLWADKTPWVYNEIGHDGSKNNISDSLKQKYADGIINGVKETFDSSITSDTASASSTDSESCGDGTASGAGGGDSIATALKYAWADYRGNDVTMKPEYKAATDAAVKDGRYIGGISYPGVDCGGFVTTVMVDSGYEPNYNHGGKLGQGASNTVGQLAWVRANWQKIGKVTDTSKLQPGDVAFRVTSSGDNDGHTFMYVGEQPGFGDDIASASLDQRAPMAGPENPTATNIEWYRKI